MRLRDRSGNQRPGRYREFDGPTRAERPAFVHDDPTFDAEVVTHCAFPSLDMHYPGPGPSEFWKTHHRLEVAAAKHPVLVFDCDQEEESEQEGSEDIKNNDDPRNIDDSHHNDVVQVCDGPETSSSLSQCPSSTIAIPHRLILTAKAMSRLPQGSVETEQHHHLRQPNTLTDEDGDTMMVSSARETQDRHGEPPRRLRFTVNLTRRPISPGSFPREALDSSGAPPRRAKTVSLPWRDPRKARVEKDPADTPGIVESPVEENFWVTDIFKPYSNWPNPSYIVQDSDDDEEIPVNNPFLSYPNWSELSDGVKYLIFYGLTDKGLSFTQACRSLSLKLSESDEMVKLITKQRSQIQKAKEQVSQANDSGIDWLGHLLSRSEEEQLVTDSLTNGDIRRGRAFLKFLGLKDVAKNLGYYQQSLAEGKAEDYDIPLNHFTKDGFEGLLPHFIVGCSDEELNAMWIAAKAQKLAKRPAMSDGELHVRMDAPPGTVNPNNIERIEHIDFRRDLDALAMGRGLPLHPDNYLEEFDDGTFYSVLDESFTTNEEMEERRVLQALQAAKATAAEQCGRPPASMQNRRDDDRFPLLNAVQRGEAPILPPRGQWIHPAEMERIRDRVKRVLAAQGLNGHQTLPPAQVSVPDVPGIRTQATEDQQPTAINRTRPSQPNDEGPASINRPNVSPIVDLNHELEMVVNHVISRYQHQFNEPAKSTRASLGRRSQSFDIEFDEDLMDSSTVQKKKKKRVQFEDDSYDEDESHNTKKKSPDKKGQREPGHHGSPPSSAGHSQTSGGRRTSYDGTPTRGPPKRRRNVIYSDASVEDDSEHPHQTIDRDVGDVGMAHRDQLQPIPKTHGSQGEAPSTVQPPRRTTNRAVPVLIPASEYYVDEPCNSSEDDEASAGGTFCVTDTRSGQRDTTGFRGGLAPPMIYHEAPITDNIPSREVAREHGNFQPGRLTPEKGDLARQQTSNFGKPEAFFVLKSPPAPRNIGLGAVPQNKTSQVSGHTRQLASVLPLKEARNLPEVTSHTTPSAPTPAHHDTREPTSVHTALQGGLRLGTPFLTPEGRLIVQKLLGRDTAGAGTQGQELNTPDEPGREKAAKKSKTQRKKKPTTKGETALDDSSKSQPSKRQSTTPIPLPFIPGMKTPLPRMPDIRKPASYMPKPNGPRLDSPQPDTGNQGEKESTGGARSGSRETMSEQQIREMGGKRAELEIYKNRERAKSAAASSSRSSSNGSSNGSQTQSKSSPNAAKARPGSSSTEPTDPNISQVQGSPGMPTSATTGATSSNPFSGRLGVGPQVTGRVSPMSNLPENFGLGQTSSYIRGQDQSINRAFDVAKQATTFNLRMPSGTNGNDNGGPRASFVPGPTAGPNALLRQYHQNVSQQTQSGTTQRPRAPASTVSMGGGSVNAASVHPRTSAGSSRPMQNIAATHSRQDGSPNPAPNLGPGQQIMAPTRTSGIDAGVKTGHGPAAVFAPPSQFTGFPHPNHQATRQAHSQGQHGGTGFSQMPATMTASSPQMTQARIQRQPQRLLAEQYQQSMPASTPAAGPIVSGTVMGPPQFAPRAAMNMNTGPAVFTGSLNEMMGVGWETRVRNQQGVHLGSEPYLHANQYQGGRQNISQQDLQGTTSMHPQFPGRNQGQVYSNSRFTHNNMETGANMNMDMRPGTNMTMGMNPGPGSAMGVNMGVGAGMNSGISDLAIDPRILGDMTDMGDVDMANST